MVEALAHPKWLLATNCSRCWVLQHRRLPSPSPQPASRHLAAHCHQKRGVQRPSSACSLPRGGFWQAAPLPQARERAPTLPLQGQRCREQRHEGSGGRGGFVVSLSRHRHGRGEQSRPACVPRGSHSFALALQTPRICSGLPPEVAAQPGAGSWGAVGRAGGLARSFLDARALLSEALGFFQVYSRYYLGFSTLSSWVPVAQGSSSGPVAGRLSRSLWQEWSPRVI